MAYSTNFRNAAVNAVGQNGGADWFSLHTADPGTTGASEVTGGSYARVSASFPAAVGGSSTNAGATINVPAGTTVTYWSRWTAQTGGTWYAGGALPNGGEAFGSSGTYTLTNTITQPAS
jgi:hypothetical protein